MSKSIECSIDVSKIDKNRIEEREYTNKEGKIIKQKLYKFTVVESKDKKMIKEGDGWTLFKTHFIAEKRDKDEEKNYIGDGMTFENTDKKEVIDFPEDDINPNDIPF